MDDGLLEFRIWPHFQLYGRCPKCGVWVTGFGQTDEDAETTDYEFRCRLVGCLSVWRKAIPWDMSTAMFEDAEARWQRVSGELAPVEE